MNEQIAGRRMTSSSDIFEQMVRRSGDAQAEVPRDQYGRPLIVPAGGGKPQPFTRVTTIADALEDQYNLTRWSNRMVALGLTQRHDLYARVAACRDDDKTSLNQICDAAKEAAAASGPANLGTALHEFLERIDAGEDVNVPAPWDRDVDQYRACLEVHDVKIVPGMIERLCVIPQMGAAGTFDRLVTVGDYPLPVIADLKTGNYLSWGKFATQLAIYANAETLYDPATQRHTPMPQVSRKRGLIIHLLAGQGTCRLYWVNLAAGWEAAQHSLWARGWRRRKDLWKEV